MQVDEYNDFHSLLSRYQAALRRIRDLGIKISATSRLAQYRNRLDGVIQDPRPALEEAIVFALAFDLREIDEVIEIVENLPAIPDGPTLELLGRLPRGTQNPDDEKSTRAREAQYELYLGTLARRAGMRGEHGHPDLRITHGASSYLLEAKRPSSADRVDERLRGAVHQIRAHGTKGIIAISLDQVVRPSRGILDAPYLNAVAPAVSKLVMSFIQTHGSMWKQRLSGEPIDGLLFTARVPARLPTGHLVTGTAVHVEPFVEDETAASQHILATLVREYQRTQKREADERGSTV